MKNVLLSDYMHACVGLRLRVSVCSLLVDGIRTDFMYILMPADPPLGLMAHIFVYVYASSHLPLFANDFKKMCIIL